MEGKNWRDTKSIQYNMFQLAECRSTKSKQMEMQILCSEYKKNVYDLLALFNQIMKSKKFNM